jgi:ribosome biogenesis GTPase / thiamine phosphate phosphatase
LRAGALDGEEFMSMTELEGLGWDAFFAEAFREHEKEGCVPGRIAAAQRDIYVVWTAAGERRAGLAGRLRHDTARAADLPAVGDWVAVRREKGSESAVVVAVLPRKGAFSRKRAGDVADEQVVAANVDTLFLVCGLDGDFNIRRIERSLVLAWESGAAPVILLNKADACPDPEVLAQQARVAAPGVPVHVVSARAGTGMDALGPYLGAGRTTALIGSSGVGKSTLVNRLLSRDMQSTREVRARDGRGQHSTTRRELIRLPGGAVLVDTPGWRELQLWTEGAGLEHAFDDVEALAARCRFRDCTHREEPGCAVRATLDAERMASYHKLKAERESQARRREARARIPKQTKRLGRRS